MTYQNDFTLRSELMEQVQEQGLNVLPELIRVFINTAMLAERRDHLNAEPYQHTSERRGYADGFKPKTMQTRVGTSPSWFHKCGRVAFIHKLLKEACGANEP